VVVLVNLIIQIFLIMIIYWGFKILGIIQFQESPSMHISMRYPYMAVPVGGIFMFINSFRVMVAAIQNRIPGSGGSRMTAVLFVSLLICFVLGVPIAFSLGVASVATLQFASSLPLTLAAQRLFTGADSFPLMAIPFFMLAGELMESGGISRRLFDFAHALVGFVCRRTGHGGRGGSHVFRRYFRCGCCRYRRRGSRVHSGHDPQGVS
jgi:hypothetical protein